MMRFLRSAFAFMLICVAFPAAAQPAFPGAVGFGAVASGGRGGRVLHVTTLAASGPGSLAEAVGQTGPRYIVFDVSGVIEADIEISNGDLTIAGQSAPGAGITIRGHLFTTYGEGVTNIVVRHIRVRPPPPGGAWPAGGHDAIQFSDARRVYFDHVDASHGVDEIVDHWNGGTEITWASSILSFADPDGGHPDGRHPYCLIAHDGDAGSGGGRVSVIGNLFAHCRVRTPALAIGPTETLQNVVYGAREAFVHHNPARGDFVIADNTYIDGPGEDLLPFFFDPENDPAPTRYFLGANAVEHPGTFEGTVLDPWTTPGFADAYGFAVSWVGPEQFHPLSDAPRWDGGHVVMEPRSASEAYERVLACAGAWPRDHVSRTALQETASRTGRIRTLDVGDLMAGLTPAAASADGDRDGMPDSWESAHGLDPAVQDHSMPLGGWPALEVYLDEIARSITGCDPVAPVVDGGVGPSDRDGGGGGIGRDAGTSARLDGGRAPAELDGGRAPASVSGSCGCNVPSRQGRYFKIAALGLAAGLWLRARRRRPADRARSRQP